MSNQPKTSEIVWKVDDEDNLRAYHSDNLNKAAVWAPQPGSQEAFLSCPVHEALYEGSRGLGKTDALIMDFAQHVNQGFGEDWRGILFRRTSPELKDVIAKANKWFHQIFPTATYNRASRTWRFKDGEELIFSFMDVEEDYWKQHGSNFPWIGWEELTNWPNLDLYKRMMSTNRSTNKNIPIKIRATCNPHGAGHNTVKARFNLPAPTGHLTTGIIKTPREPDRVAIHGTVYENKILLHAQPDYIDVLRASCNSPAEEAAWIEGSWDITSGGMFDDLWDPKFHVLTGITPQMIPKRWRMDRSYDHGQSKPFSVGWWAQSNGEPLTLPSGQIVGQVKGDLIRIQEWYGWDGTPDKGLRMTSSEIAIGIRERQREMGIDNRVHPGVADGSIFDQWEPGKSVQGDMRKKGVRWLRADKGPGTRIQGWQQCRKLLKQAIPVEGYRELPGLFVSDLCTQFLRTFPVLSRGSGKKDPDDVDTDIEDHIADEVRYRCRAKQAKRSKMIQG